MKKYLPLIPVVIAVCVLGTLFVRSRDTEFTTAQVTRGPIEQEVLASGNVAAQSTIALQFQNGGRLSAVRVTTGDTVAAGTVLAQLDTSVQMAQLLQAQAAVQTQQSILQSLLQGTRPEQLAITDSQIASDKNTLSQANRALINAIQTAYTQADDAVSNKVDPIFSNPHSPNPLLNFNTSNSQLSSAIITERIAIESIMSSWAKSFSQLSTSGDLSAAVVEANAHLAAVSQFLNDVNSLLSVAIASQQASATTISSWVTNVATARSSVNTAASALTAAVIAQQNAGAALDKDQKTLALQMAGSTQASIDAQRALVAQAQANVATMQEQIAQMRILAPVNGTITNVNGDVGETVSPQSTVVTMIPNTKLQIDVNLSEDSVARVRVGNTARITLDAFQGEERHGTVTSIDPAQTIVGGAVYYKTTVVLNDAGQDIRPGMTANIWIQTGSSQSSLLVPASALKGRTTLSQVEVLVNGAPQTREVRTGLRGEDGMVEILSGLSEGESVIVATE